MAVTNFSSEIYAAHALESEGNLSQTWLYVVGDGRSPGAYEFIDGYALCQEGAAELEDLEDVDAQAKAFADAIEGDVAIVGKTLSEGDVIDEFVSRIVKFG